MKTQRLIVGIGLALMLSSCPLYKEDSTGSGTPPGGGSGVFPEDIAEGDGLSSTPEGLAEALYDAAAACGWQSVKTVPGGWQPVMVSTDGCTQWIPLEWAILGQADAAGFSPDTSRRVYTFTLVNPLPSGYDWDADAVIDYLTDSIAVEFGAEPPSVLWRQVTDVADLEVADAAFAFFMDGEPLVGSIRIHFGGCAPSGGACFALVMGYWLPVADLEEHICELAQIDGSLQCPGLGACIDPVCSSWCIHDGESGGACDGDTCSCF